MYVPYYGDTVYSSGIGKELWTRFTIWGKFEPGHSNSAQSSFKLVPVIPTVSANSKYMSPENWRTIFVVPLSWPPPPKKKGSVGRGKDRDLPPNPTPNSQTSLCKRVVSAFSEWDESQGQWKDSVKFMAHPSWRRKTTSSSVNRSYVSFKCPKNACEPTLERIHTLNQRTFDYVE